MRYRRFTNWPSLTGPDTRECAPELMLAVRNIPTGEFQAVHRTRLPHLGSGPQRSIRGPAGGGAIMLTPRAKVMAAGELAISEGWESGLAAMRLGFRNVWTVLNAGGVENLPVLDGIGKLTILAENNDANKKAREEAGDRWLRAGREVVYALPKTGDDFADQLEASR
jgi:hypothetical protein